MSVLPPLPPTCRAHCVWRWARIPPSFLHVWSPDFFHCCCMHKIHWMRNYNMAIRRMSEITMSVFRDTRENTNQVFCILLILPVILNFNTTSWGVCNVHGTASQHAHGNTDRHWPSTLSQTIHHAFSRNKGPRESMETGNITQTLEMLESKVTMNILVMRNLVCKSWMNCLQATLTLMKICLFIMNVHDELANLNIEMLDLFSCATCLEMEVHHMTTHRWHPRELGNILASILQKIKVWQKCILNDFFPFKNTMTGTHGSCYRIILVEGRLDGSRAYLQHLHNMFP